MLVRSPDGRVNPLGEIAEVSAAAGPSLIRRVDSLRAFTVLASVDGRVTTPDAVIATARDQVLPGLRERFPGVDFSVAGMAGEAEESQEALARSGLLAVMLIFVLLAIPLGSWTQPFLILAAIPFGLAGAVYGHLIMGIDLDSMSLFGMVPLIGIVVNDALVMLDFTNRRRAQGPFGPGGGASVRTGALPGRHPDLADHLRRRNPPVGGEQLSGRPPDSDGGVAGFRSRLRHSGHLVRSAGSLQPRERRDRRVLKPRPASRGPASVERCGPGRGGVEQMGAPRGGDSAREVVALGQVRPDRGLPARRREDHHRAPESGPGEAGPERARTPRTLDERVQFGGAHFVVAPQALVGCIEQCSERWGVTLFEAADRDVRAMRLRDDVAKPSVERRWQPVRGGEEVRQGVVGDERRITVRLGQEPPGEV